METESTAGEARTNIDASRTDNRDCRLCDARADGVVVRRDGSTMPVCRACGRTYGERDDREVATDGGTAREREDARPADGLTVLATRLRERANRIEVAAGRAPEGRLARDDQVAVVESVHEAIDDLRRVLDVVNDADQEVGDGAE